MAGKNVLPPASVGIIMDGNGRWARRRLMPRYYGHRAGMNRIVKLVDFARSAGIKYLTMYALSTENLARPKEELDELFTLFRTYFEKYAPQLVKENVSIRIIGDLSVLPKDVSEKMNELCALSPEGATFHLIFAVNYGGRAEIVRAANLAAADGEITEESFSRALYTHGVPDPDLIIRTGGEIRLSNFLLWQSAYSELYFTDTLFPDFDERAFGKALDEYSRRNRRFGKV